MTRVEQLQTTGCLTAAWATVPRGWEASYRAMVVEMARHGIDCDGRPPMWAWAGPVTWGDAFGLLAEDEVAQGYATVAFQAPRDQVLLTEYAPWCDALGVGEWPSGDECLPAVDPGRVMQATVPRIDMRWVTGIRPLPTHGIHELDWNTPA